MRSARARGFVDDVRRASTTFCAFVVGLVLVIAAPPLVLSADINHSQHPHPVDMAQWSERAPGDVRCYCNLPACITTGYMCKSAGRGCFSDLVDHVDVFRARHGCLDLIGSDRQRQCKNQPRPDPEVDDVPAWERNEADTDTDTDTEAAGSPPQQLAGASLLLCCAEDMCNHIDSPDSRIRQSGQNGSDGSHAVLSQVAVGQASIGAPTTGAAGSGAMLPGTMAGVSVGSGAGTGASGGLAIGSAAAAGAAGVGAVSQSAEVWFKAATIAVPICGALILFLLIALAVRLLRADSQHHRMAAHKLRMAPGNFPALSDKKIPLLQHQGTSFAPCNVLLEGHGVHSKCKQVLASFMPWNNNPPPCAPTANV